ncbi:GNAT family N-acetyltransferase [Fructobacillus evanidus]|uniref:Predicted acetyltransferase n=1 Tax=Fructobacillus evanidus TaxID=3064281 RepID=A0ABM9MUH1_9LACO|nr:Predicted acetyltransferase [Fructobacillus sp. LMG 32999]CAK1238020.1 Predicted acetyltransferase [Fructobacillus sp. LMG 32999]CAK1240825.1 Predicted acetyltransferase [Fructobacillus sp. LMG 32999]CAK1243854.1 Predicted acetyltransferase [Fructobacillus sp. LMG 32999]CAK1244194.1 Predicted acetyltransferase [Fructobacillus sp. LMG 32999]
MHFAELTLSDELLYRHYKNSWKTRMVPGSSSSDMPFPDYLQKLEDDKTNKNGKFVPAKTLFLFDHDVIVGCVQIRYLLTKNLMIEGGNVGYGVHPDFRGLGYGTKLLEHALQELKKSGINEAVLTCDSENPASRNVILNCHGALNAKYEISNVMKERYLIPIK